MITPYYADDSVTLYKGDCREILPQLDIRPDLVMADPPYEATSCGWDRWPAGWLEAVASVASSMWCFLPLRAFAEPPYRGQEFRAAGWKLSHDIEPAWNEEHDHVTWEKHHGTGFQNDRFRAVHEPAGFWYRGRWADIYRDPQRVPYTGPDSRHGYQGRGGRYHTGDIAEGRGWVDDGTRLMHSVIKVPSMWRRGAIHATEKPVELLDPLIRYGCPPGGLVLDPGAGSGSAAAAARLSGRRAILVEGDEQHCAKIADRLSRDVLPFPVEAAS